MSTLFSSSASSLDSISRSRQQRPALCESHCSMHLAARRNIPVHPLQRPSRPSTTFISAHHSRDVSRHALLTANDIGNDVSGVNSSSPFPSRGVDLGWSTAFRQNYAFSKMIGQGSFGLVHEGIDRRSGQTVAVKIMPKERTNLPKSKALARLSMEIDILERLQVCQNVVRLNGCYEDDANVQIVMEVCGGGDLQQIVEANGCLDEKMLALVAKEILVIVKACHEIGILHGDVKPANFCVKDPLSNPLLGGTSATPWLKALDFGCSQNLGHKRLFKRSGTPIFMAPELFARDYGKAADVWSLGVTLYWMFAQRFPFFATAEQVQSAQLQDVVTAVKNEPIEMNYGSWLNMSANGLDFVSRCLDRDEASRLTVEQALSHPWLQEL
eukprot:gene25630-11287_t